MPSTTFPAAEFVADARVIFDDYLDATRIPEFVRSFPSPGSELFTYPQRTIQTDMAAFSVVFTCLWRVLHCEEYFSFYYTEKAKAFEDIGRIVTPNDNDPMRLTAHAGFWRKDNSEPFVRVPLNDERSVYEVCRTLRNGFGHFNFRYTDVAPDVYFRRLTLTLPSDIPDPSVPNNYRVFICDWRNHWRGRQFQFGDIDSNSRIAATHFAHLRYHLFLFLARFFSEPGTRPYKDILTGEDVT